MLKSFRYVEYTSLVKCEISIGIPYVFVKYYLANSIRIEYNFVSSESIQYF